MIKKNSSALNLLFFPPQFTGTMKNLPPGKQNVTDFECGFYLNPLLFNSAVIPYVLISLPANSWVLWLMKSSPVFWTDQMEVSEFHLVLAELLFGFLGPPLLIISFYFNTEIIQSHQHNIYS